MKYMDTIVNRVKSEKRFIDTAKLCLLAGLVMVLSSQVKAQSGFAAEYGLYGESVSDVVVADFDLDGDNDIIFTRGISVFWLENDGSGSFGTATPILNFSGGKSKDEVDVGDLDGDGDMDVVTYTGAFSEILWYQNGGDMSFTLAENLVSTDIPFYIPVLLLSDIDGDEDLDVVSTSPADDNVVWYENNGSGVFAAEQVIAENQGSINDVLVSDIDHDLDMDVVTSAPGANKIAWFKNQGDGSFESEVVITTSVQNPNSVFAADISGDQVRDILSGSRDDGKVAWYHNQGESFIGGTQEIVSTSANRTSEVIAADLNEDNLNDIIYTASNGSQIIWVKNQLGLDAYDAPRTISDSANSATELWAADLNGDERPDIIAKTSDGLVWFDNQTYQTNIPEPPYEVGDIINYNGSFTNEETGETTDVFPWTLNSAEGASATFSIIEDNTVQDNRSLQVEVGAFNDGEDWHVEAVNEPFNVVANDVYEASINLKADSDSRVAGFYFGLPASGDWARYVETDVELNTEWQRFVLEYTATETDQEHGMRFATSLNFEANDGATIMIDKLEVKKISTVSSEEETGLPEKFTLRQNYPNPFNPTTNITFSLPQSSKVTLRVYDIIGREVASVLVGSSLNQGVHSVTFDAETLTSGVYLYRLTAGSFAETKSMVLIK